MSAGSGLGSAPNLQGQSPMREEGGDRWTLAPPRRTSRRVPDERSRTRVLRARPSVVGWRHGFGRGSAAPLAGAAHA